MAATNYINEGFELVSKRIDTISDRADRASEAITARMIELMQRLSDMAADQKIVLAQVRLTNGTVIRHEERLTALERRAAADALALATKESVAAVEKQVHDGLTKRSVLTGQGKVLWALALIVFAAAAGAFFMKLFRVS